MDNLSREVLRMELQISELIRVVANLNERLKQLEHVGNNRVTFEVAHAPRKI